MYEVIYKTTPCFKCGESSELLLPKEGIRKWLDGAYVQEAFPNESADVRELIKTGIHPECWDKIMGSD